MLLEVYDSKKHDSILDIPKEELNGRDCIIATVAIADNRVIATAQVEDYKKFKTISIFVNEEFRNMNIASILILFTHNILKDMNYKEIFAIINKDNYKSRQMFENLGYDNFLSIDKYDVCIYNKNLRRINNDKDS